jgi:hypothetical protein
MIFHKVIGIVKPPLRADTSLIPTYSSTSIPRVAGSAFFGRCAERAICWNQCSGPHFGVAKHYLGRTITIQI